MSNFRLILILGIALLIGGQSLSAKEKNEEQDKEQVVKELVENRNYIIDVNRAIPLQGSSINLTSSYSLKIKGDSAISYLPYFGRAYSAPYGGGNGLRFEENISDYTLSFDKKGTAKIKFTARTNEDKYTFNVQIFDNGSSTIIVTPTNKQSITFYGELNLRQEEE